MRRTALLPLALPLASLACSETPKTLTMAQLQDPEACVECHRDQVTEWRGSRHAKATSSPMFQALSAHAETTLGNRDLCLGCHGPLIAEAKPGATDLDLDQFDESMQGITCFYCHSVESIAAPHNNGLVIATDGVMRGGFDEPFETDAHASAYSPLQDRRDPQSSALCGSCHDVVLADNVPFERTYQEWSETLFAEHGEPWALGCNDCHMDGRDGAAAQVEGSPTRRVHSHMFPGVDVPLEPSEQTDLQTAAVLQVLQTTLWAELCVSIPDEGATDEGATATVTLQNLTAGHSFPSGAAQDRRAWVQLRALDADGGEDQPLYESGVVADNEAVTKQEDPDLWLMWNELLDANGDTTHVLWEATSYESHLLPAATAISPADPDYVDTHVVRTYSLGATAPDRVTLDVFLRPMAYDVIDEVIDAGTLDPSMRDAWPTFSVLPRQVVWTADLGTDCAE
jgi:hypothetical protein